MKYITAIIYLTILSTIYSSCCKKEPEPPEPPELTPKTTTGEETLSFLKDGEVWIADKDALSPVASIALGSKQFSLGSRKKLPMNQSEIFNWSFPLRDYHMRKYIESDTIALQSGWFPDVDTSDYCKPIWEPFAEYKIVTLGTTDSFNYINITHIDWSGNFNIISGIFQLRLANEENEECQDTIYITDGRFDLEFDVKP